MLCARWTLPALALALALGSAGPTLEAEPRHTLGTLDEAVGRICDAVAAAAAGETLYLGRVEPKPAHIHVNGAGVEIARLLKTFLAQRGVQLTVQGGRARRALEVTFRPQRFRMDEISQVFKPAADGTHECVILEASLLDETGSPIQSFEAPQARLLGRDEGGQKSGALIEPAADVLRLLGRTVVERANPRHTLDPAEGAAYRGAAEGGGLKGGLLRVGLRVGEQGHERERPIAVQPTEKRAVVKLKEGERYVLDLVNLAGQDELLVRVFVDGVSVFAFAKDEKLRRSGYLVPAGGALVVDGWRTDLEGVFGFRIGNTAGSAAERAGLGAGAPFGTISFEVRRSFDPKGSGAAGKGPIATHIDPKRVNSPAKQVERHIGEVVEFLTVQYEE